MVTLLFLASSAFAEPVQVPVQVRVLDPAGGPLNGEYDVTVTLWNDASSTDVTGEVFREELTNVRIADGFVSVVLGADDDLDNAQLQGDLWVGMAIDSAPEMLPRMPVGTAPKAGAVVGLPADDIETLTSGGNADALHTHALTVDLDNPWVACGDLSDLQAGSCQLSEFPALEYEYGFTYNTPIPHVLMCTTWNRGFRMYNRDPYVVNADNPSGNVNFGGSMWYTGTDASDDNSCSGDNWRHKYWRLSSGTVVPFSSNGCFNRTIYCRKR